MYLFKKKFPPKTMHLKTSLLLCLFFLLIINKEKEFDFMKIGKVNISKKSLVIICVILFTIIISIVLFRRVVSKTSGVL